MGSTIPRSDHPTKSRKERATLTDGTVEHTLIPRAPFCFRKAREVTASFSPDQDQVLVNETVHRPFRVGGRTVLASIVSHGSIENPRLGITLEGDTDLDPEPFLRTVAEHLSMDDDLEPMYQVGFEDPVFGGLVARLYGLHQVRFVSPFASACWAILSAHTPLNVAKSMQSNLLRACGGSVVGPNGPLWAFPEPSDFLDAGEERINGAIHNGRKTRYLLSAARSFHDADLNLLRTSRYDEVRAWLREIDGIGPWGASLVMIRGLGRMERLPENEKALIKAASAAYGRRVTEDELPKLAERYGQSRAYWAYYLRIAAEGAVKS